MNEILQGTTPSLEIKINTSDFIVSDVIQVEFTMQHRETTTIHGLSDVTVDTEENSFIYTFTEAETLAMSTDYPLKYQLRFMFNDGTIMGTVPMSIQVADLISEEVMTE